jgi:hypothetical protein
MNSYFQSLLQVDKNRKKNRCLIIPTTRPLDFYPRNRSRYNVEIGDYFKFFDEYHEVTDGKGRIVTDNHFHPLY